MELTSALRSTEHRLAHLKPDIFGPPSPPIILPAPSSKRVRSPKDEERKNVAQSDRKALEGKYSFQCLFLRQVPFSVSASIRNIVALYCLLLRLIAERTERYPTQPLQTRSSPSVLLLALALDWIVPLHRLHSSSNLRQHPSDSFPKADLRLLDSGTALPSALSRLLCGQGNWESDMAPESGMMASIKRSSVSTVCTGMYYLYSISCQLSFVEPGILSARSLVRNTASLQCERFGNE